MTQVLSKVGGVLLALTILSGCQSVYYGTLEKVGIHKRDVMVDRVEDARDSQQEAKEEFSSALEQFQHMFGRQDSDLQQQYDKLSAAYEDSKGAAEDVRDHVDAVESVSEALFEEWEEELKLYSSASLRKDSAAKLQRTKRSYRELINAMRAAEKRMDPVLAAFQDQVLYLKHNLNARAIDGLRGELRAVETDVARLVKEMEKAIAESDSFISELREG